MVEKHQNFPNGLEAFFLIVMLFAAEYLAGAALYDMNGTLSMNPLDLGGMTTLLAHACVFTAVMQYRGLRYRQLFHSSSSTVAATLFVLLPAIALTIPALLLLMAVLMKWLMWLLPMSSSQEAMINALGSGGLGAFVVVCVLAPVLEEMFFRGLILRSFLFQYSKWTAIVGSALLFGMAHMNVYQFAVASLLGVVLGWLYERTRSLWPGIAMHAAYNLGWLVLASGKEDFSAGFDVSVTVWGAALLLGAAGTFMLWRLLMAPASVRP